MSYEIVKSITVKGNDVFITSACNNLRPLTYSKWSVSGASLNEKIGKVLLNIMDGEFQLSPFNKKLAKWNYVATIAEYKNDITKEMHRNLWDVKYNGDKYELMSKLIDELAKMYNDLKEQKGKFIIQYGDEASPHYLKELTKHWFIGAYFKKYAKTFETNIQAEWFMNALKEMISRPDLAKIIKLN